MSDRTQRIRLILATAAGVTGVLLVIYRWKLPPYLFVAAGHDDFLFVRLAGNISSGGWLGDLNNLTLVKGAVWPLTISISTAANMPPLVIPYVMYVFSCLLIGVSLGRLAKRETTGWFIGIFMMLAPFPFGLHASRLIRDMLFTSLVLSCVALVIFYVSCQRNTVDRNLAKANFQGFIRESKFSTYAIIAAGSVLGLAWLTREERQWLVSVSIALLLVAFVGGENRSAKSIIIIGLLFLVPVALLTQVNKFANHHNYGVALANDSSYGEFDDFLRNLQSVNADKTTNRQFVPIRNSQFQAAYTVSPLVAELEPFLEGDLERWITPGCSTYGICDEFAGGWASWAIRDAIESSGNWKSAEIAQDYMRDASNEIANACFEKQISCIKPISSLGSFSGIDAPTLLKAIRNDMYSLTSPGYGYLEYSEVVADQVVWDVWRNNTHGLNSTTEIFNKRTLGLEQTFGNFQKIWSDTYSKILSVATIIALIGYVRFMISRSSSDPINRITALIGFMSLMIVISRSTMLALVHLTSFPAIGLSYSLPSIPLLYIFISCGFLLMLNVSGPTIFSKTQKSATRTVVYEQHPL
jgi:hypothetical protein